MLQVIEMFSSIQGEGMFVGKPSFFVRTTGCNLRCAFKGSICDTPYSSYNPEKPLYNTMDELADAFNEMRKQSPHTKHLVITGGEPLLQGEAVSEFLTRVNGNGDLVVTIETNGTMPPIEYKDEDGEDVGIDLYSISPKLSSSVGMPNSMLTEKMIQHHNKTRLNPENLADIFAVAHVQFKFVYSGPEAEAEIDELMKRVCDEFNNKYSAEYRTAVCGPNVDNSSFNINMNNYIMLMPEGITNEQLSKTSKEAAEICIRRGWRFTDRLHIRIWGDKRGV